MIRLRNSLAALVIGGGFVQAANAGAILHSDFVEGSSVQNYRIDDVDVSVKTRRGVIQNKTLAGFSAVGVSGGYKPGEIDGREYIIFRFSTPVKITSLSVAYLFAAGADGDQWHEQAKFITDSGAARLKVKGAATARWTRFGTVANDSPAVAGGAGAWTVSGENLFPGAVTRLRLKSARPGSSAAFSDFAFVGMEFTPVPAPGALALLGVAGLAATRRRRS